MKNSFVASFVILFIFAGFLFELTAQPYGNHGNQWRRNNFYNKLDLSPEQKEQIKQLRIKHQNTMSDLRASLQKARLEVRNIIEAGNIDRAKYIAAIESVSKIQNKMKTEQANHKMDIYNLLNDKQKKIVEDYPGWFRNAGFGNGMNTP